MRSMCSHFCFWIVGNSFLHGYNSAMREPFQNIKNQYCYSPGHRNVMSPAAMPSFLSPNWKHSQKTPLESFGNLQLLSLRKPRSKINCPEKAQAAISSSNKSEEKRHTKTADSLLRDKIFSNFAFTIQEFWKS